MFPNPPPTFAYCKSWGVGVPQGLGIGSAQIRVSGWFRAVRPSRLSIRPSVRRSLHLVRLALILLVVCDICVSFGFLAKFLMFVTALEFEGVFLILCLLWRYRGVHLLCLSGRHN